MLQPKLFTTQTVKDAFYYSAEMHDGQYRKGTRVPYFVHPAMVALGVSEYTKDEHTIVAAVLHDVLEDCKVSSDDLLKKFSRKIVKIVEEVTATNTEGADKDWKQIKEMYVQLTAKASQEALLIIAVDKMFNMTAYFEYAMVNGTKRLDRLFGCKMEDFFWYYGEILKVLDSKLLNRSVVKDYRKKLDYYADALLS